MSSLPITTTAAVVSSSSESSLLVIILIVVAVALSLTAFGLSVYSTVRVNSPGTIAGGFGGPTSFSSFTWVFNTAGTHLYTPSPGMKYAIVEMVGGGGGGGGIVITSNDSSASGGGGGGAYMKIMIIASDLNGESQIITVGSGGSGGNPGGTGGDGGNTSFGTLITVGGGFGGAGRTGIGTPGTAVTGGLGGTFVNVASRLLDRGGYQFLKGGPGGQGFVDRSSMGVGGAGGVTPLLMMGNPKIDNVVNPSQTAEGLGGGGRGQCTTGVSTSLPGESGGNGGCFIFEFIML